MYNIFALGVKIKMLHILDVKIPVEFLINGRNYFFSLHRSVFFIGFEKRLDSISFVSFHETVLTRITSVDVKEYP